jgi:hypothetical protein
VDPYDLARRAVNHSNKLSCPLKGKSGLAKKSHRIVVQDFLLLDSSHILSLQKILRGIFSRLAVRPVNVVYTSTSIFRRRLLLSLFTRE